MSTDPRFENDPLPPEAPRPRASAPNAEPYQQPAPAAGAAEPAAEPTHADPPPTKSGKGAKSSKGSTGPTEDNPLRGSKASALWAFVFLLIVVLVLLVIFIAQNTQRVQVRFLGWEGDAPLVVSLLIATAAGLVIAGTAGALRILQLRRRVKRVAKQH